MWPTYFSTGPTNFGTVPTYLVLLSTFTLIPPIFLGLISPDGWSIFFLIILKFLNFL